MASFSENLRDLIAFSGLLQKEVAARAGIKKRALDMYLGSQHSVPPVDVAVRLARTLGVSVEYLAGTDGIANFGSDDSDNALYKEEKTDTAAAAAAAVAVAPGKKTLMEEMVVLEKEDRDLLLLLVRHMEKLRGMAGGGGKNDT